jgi:hypothetical protein
MAVILIFDSDNQSPDRSELNASVNQHFNPKSHHHQKITQIGFDGDRSDRNLPILKLCSPCRRCPRPDAIFEI